MAKRPTRLRFTEDDLADSHVKKAADRADKAVARAEKAADKLASKKAKPKLKLETDAVSYTHLYECKWATNTVVHILENREYTGCLVNFKTEKLSYKVKHSVENPPEKQVIFENHHEPIIDTQTWERVQELRKQRKRPNRYDEVGLFSGILFCADCGSVMYQQRYQTDKRKQDCYICGNYKKRTHDCTAHFIRTDLLTAGVLSNLRKVTSYAAKHEARFMKLLIEQNEDGGKRRNAAKKKELEAAEKRIGELSAIFKRLYDCLLYTSDVYKRQEYADFTERLKHYDMRQAGFIRQAITRMKSRFTDIFLQRKGIVEYRKIS